MVARRRMRAAIARKLAHAKSWSEANVRTKGRDVGVAAMLRATDTELRMSARCAFSDPASRNASPRGWNASKRPPAGVIRGTGVLATIGATAPFVGLFGTVWGIMNSFIGISKSHTTNLAVVAPGIAEALLATAIGLVAAIPAVVIYNVFARSIAGYRALARRCLRRGACGSSAAISIAAHVDQRRARASPARPISAPSSDAMSVRLDHGDDSSARSTRSTSRRSST